MPRTDQPYRHSRLIVLAAVCVAVAALYFGRDVLIPVALAVLISFLLAPLVERLERVGIHRVPAVMVVVVTLLGIVAALGWVVYVQMIDLADRLPGYQQDIVAKIKLVTGGGQKSALTKATETIENVAEAVAGPATQTTQPTTAASATTELLNPPGAAITGPGPSLASPVPVTIVPEKPSPLRLLGASADRVLGTLGLAGLVMVFVIFMLLQRQDLRDRIIRLVGYGQLQVTTQALDDAASRISRFLLAQAIVNGTYGIAISLGLWAIGYFIGGEVFPNFVLWGLLCAVLRFIPYLGPWLAAAFPLALAFAVFPGYGVFIATAAMFIVIELLSNNLMEPWLYGSSTGMSTIAVLVSAAFWTWLWGPIGLVMSTPLTVCLVVIGKYVPNLKFFDILLGDEPVLEPFERVYQRLLARDQEEATDVVEEYLEKQSIDQVFDTVLLPSLAMAETDRHAGRLDEGRSQFMRTAMRQMIDELFDEARANEAKEKGKGSAGDSAAAPQRPVVLVPEGVRVRVVILPAHDEADEIVGQMLAALLNLRGFEAHAVSQESLASEMLAAVESRSADVVVVSALPPAAVAHARYLCKRLTVQFPDMDTVIGLWTVKGGLDKARQRISCAGPVRLATTLTQVMTEVHELVQHKLSGPSAQPASPRQEPAAVK
jgi:predicted PurR-regulated permease PerM